jgi:hypothetical protein
MFNRAYNTSPFLSRNIQERVRPLPTNVVQPLQKWPEAAPATEISEIND